MRGEAGTEVRIDYSPHTKTRKSGTQAVGNAQRTYLTTCRKNCCRFFFRSLYGSSRGEQRKPEKDRKTHTKSRTFKSELEGLMLYPYISSTAVLIQISIEWLDQHVSVPPTQIGPHS